MELFFKAVFRTHYRFSIKGRTFFTIIAHNQNYIRCRLEELVNNIVFSLLINPDKGCSGYFSKFINFNCQQVESINMWILHNKQ